MLLQRFNAVLLNACFVDVMVAQWLAAGHSS